MKKELSIQKKIFIFLGFFLVSFLATAIVLNLTIRKPIKPTLNNSLTESEKSLIEPILSQNKLYHEMNISAEYSTTKSVSKDTILSDILLPAGSILGTNHITNQDLENLLKKHSNPSSGDTTNDIAYGLFPIRDLKIGQKVLQVDNNYFFDNFSSGAVFRFFKFTGNDKEIDRIKQLLQEKLPHLPNQDNTLSFTQTGVTALSRAVTTKLNQVSDPLYFSSLIKDFLKSKDLTHISNEVSFADNCQGGRATTVLCADWRTLDTIMDLGTDIIELTGNHNNDYGTENNLRTIDKYHSLNLQTFGGGKDSKSAALPLKINQKNQKITLIGINHSTSTIANGQGASTNRPGANIYDPKLLKTQINEAKSNGDFIIVDVQFSECYTYPSTYREFPDCDSPIAGQKEFFRSIIDLGADLVVGTSAHQPQTFEAYQNGIIYYGLGNLFFDQTYWPDTRKSLILTHYFWNNRLLTTRISPTFYDESYQTKLMDQTEAHNYLIRLSQSSPQGN